MNGATRRLRRGLSRWGEEEAEAAYARPSRVWVVGGRKYRKVAQETSQGQARDIGFCLRWEGLSVFVGKRMKERVKMQRSVLCGIG